MKNGCVQLTHLFVKLYLWVPGSFMCNKVKYQFVIQQYSFVMCVSRRSFFILILNLFPFFINLINNDTCSRSRE